MKIAHNPKNTVRKEAKLSAEPKEVARPESVDMTSARKQNKRKRHKAGG